jgi:hypothetical protein
MTITLKKLKVNKLFYNKWPYKIECLVTAASRVVRYGAQTTLDFCDGKISSLGYNKTLVDKDKLREFTKAVIPYLDRKEEIQIRAEGSKFCLFCKDPAVYNSIVKDLGAWIWTVSEPESADQLEFLLDNENKRVLCDAIPYEKYVYKVVMRGVAAAGVKEQFHGWSKKYSDDIRISPTTEQWMTGRYQYKQDPFFYVKDSKMLTMTHLFLGNNIRKVYEYVTRDSIKG